MTSLAMIAGMLPMAFEFGEGGSQTAPLGIAVIGGLVFSTISILFFLRRSIISQPASENMRRPPLIRTMCTAKTLMNTETQFRTYEICSCIHDNPVGRLDRGCPETNSYNGRKCARYSTCILLHDTSVTRNTELTAELLLYEKAELFARVQGYVREMKVDIGDKVHCGQSLAIIEAPELQTKQAEFQSSLQAAKAKYMSSADVFQRLYKASQAKTPGIVAPVDFERGRNQYLAASASYEASRQLARSYQEVAGYLVLQALFDGVITARNADRGTLIGNNQAILTVPAQ